VPIGYYVVLIVAKPEVGREVPERSQLVLKIHASLSARFATPKRKRINLYLVLARVEAEVFSQSKLRQIDARLNRVTRTDVQRIVTLDSQRDIVAQPIRLNGDGIGSWNQSGADQPFINGS
jgi:hypothetical protein